MIDHSFKCNALTRLLNYKKVFEIVSRNQNTWFPPSGSGDGFY